jgi:hypothetical protein
MKEVTSYATNFLASFSDDGNLCPMVEVVITVSEPEFRCDEAGELRRTRKVETIRFITSASGLTKLAERFINDAQDLIETAGAYKRASAQPPQSPITPEEV